MLRCRKCGENNAHGDVYCKKCGAKLIEVARAEGLNSLLGDFRIQSLWVLRIFAYLIDLFIVMVLGFLLSVFAFIPLMIGSLWGGNWAWRGIWALPLYLGLVQIIYSVVLELIYGATFGKQLLGLMVLSRDGGKTGVYGTVLRNLSKAHWVLLLIDVAVGVTSSNIARDKYLDKVSRTYVTHSGRGVRIPFLAKPRVMESDSRELVPLEDLTNFDPFGVINLGVLLVVATTIIVNTPESLAGFLSWIFSLPQTGVVAPPNIVLEAGYWFMIAMGIWGIASGVLRYILKIYPLKAIHEVFNGVFSLVFAGFIHFYLIGSFNLTYFVAAVAGFSLTQIFFAVYYSLYME
jgi:uncharacterized RDD family membrane protein YckC